jgi:hypothetical protein
VGRCIGLNVHRDFCEAAIADGGRARSAGRVAITPEQLAPFARSLAPDDRVVAEAIGNALAIARTIEPHVAEVVLAHDKQVRAISRARIKTDKVDARVLADLQAQGDAWTTEIAWQRHHRRGEARAIEALAVERVELGKLPDPLRATDRHLEVRVSRGGFARIAGVDYSLSPGYAQRRVEKPGDFDRLLATQLERLQTDCIEFYLLHSLDAAHWKGVVEQGQLEAAERALADSRNAHLGFSFHGTYDLLEEILAATDLWEFCQIQLNYMDEDYSAGRRGLELAAGKELGMIVMEPIRGGMLARNLPPQVGAVWAECIVSIFLDTLPRNRCRSAR